MSKDQHLGVQILRVGGLSEQRDDPPADALGGGRPAVYVTCFLIGQKQGSL